MKRLWIAAALLAAAVVLALWNSWYLKSYLTRVSDLLDHAEVLAEGGDWDGAQRLTQDAYSRWDQRSCYFYTVLRHADTDEVYTGFQEVQEYLSCQEAGEYSAANARLTAQLRLLWEMEQLTLQNLL